VRISLLALGGTIASPVDATGGNAEVRLGADHLLAGLPQAHELGEITATTFRRTMSAALTLGDILDLAHVIDASDADAFVVTQGTDTLEECAWLLDLATHGDRPVVVTGAMRNAGIPGHDGPANLLAALRTAASPLAVGLGVVVVLGDEIHAARFAQKTSSSTPSAFRSPGLGPLGWIVEGRVRIPIVPRTRTRAVDLPSGTPPASIALVKLSLGDDGAPLRGIDPVAVDGLVVETYGAGHVSPGALAEVRRIAPLVPVVFVSRTGAGETYRAVGDFPGSEQDLLRAGCIAGGALDGLKARVMLSLLVASGAERDEIARRFEETCR
jgi:L-asparaginase